MRRKKGWKWRLKCFEYQTKQNKKEQKESNDKALLAAALTGFTWSSVRLVEVGLRTWSFDGASRAVILASRIYISQLPPGPPLPGWAEIRQWAYSTQIPLYKDGDTSPSLVLTGSLGLIDKSYRDREIGVSPVGPTLAAAWG